MARFTVSLAELAVGMESRDDFARRFCADYVIPDERPVIQVSSTPEEIRAEARLAATGEAIAEMAVLYRHIAEQLPLHDRCVFHGAAISYDGRAYLFTAPSGTGKSTHIRLWRRHLGDAVDIVNGDKPILHITPRGVRVCATPWAGKEGWQRNCILPLAGIGLLQRGTVDAAVAVDPFRCLPELFNQVYLPRDAAAAGRTLELIDTLGRQVPFWRLTCTMEETAVKAAFEAMTGLPYPSA